MAAEAHSNLITPTIRRLFLDMTTEREFKTFPVAFVAKRRKPNIIDGEGKMKSIRIAKLI